MPAICWAFPATDMSVERQIISRGLVAGAFGGVLAFAFARLFVDSALDRAIDFEHARAGDEVGVHEHGVELFSRGVQANVGMAVGVVAFSLAMGALFSIAFITAYDRFGGLGPRALSIQLALGAFGAGAFVPFLKYPPNPPAVGLPESLRDRTGWYLLMVLLSLTLAIVAVGLGHRMAARVGQWGASLLAVAAYLLAMMLVMLVLPGVAETPQDFPADALYDFRLYSLLTQLVMWASIGVLFGSLESRPRAERSPTEGAVRGAG